MSLKAKGLLSSLIAGVIFLAVFFFIMPWLILILAVMGIAVFASVFLGRGRINITTIRVTNTQHGNLIQTEKMVSPKVECETGWARELHEQIPDSVITIYPDDSILEAATEEDSF